MLRFGILGFVPVLCCVIAAAPAAAQEKLPTGTPTEQIDVLRRQVQDLEKRVGVIESRLGVPREDVAEMRKLLNDMQAQLRRYETPRDLSRSYTPEAPRLVPALTGNLRVINRSFVDVNVRVNNQTFDVLAGQTALLPSQLAGPLVYEVFAENYGVLQPPVTRVLKTGDPLTITVYPR